MSFLHQSTCTLCTMAVITVIIKILQDDVTLFLVIIPNLTKNWNLLHPYFQPNTPPLPFFWQKLLFSLDLFEHFKVSKVLSFLLVVVYLGHIDFYVSIKSGKKKVFCSRLHWSCHCMKVKKGLINQPSTGKYSIFLCVC